MGVPIEEYRVRIGLHVSSQIKSKWFVKVSGSKQVSHTMLNILPALTLCVLLLIMSGIEPNPGPQFKCVICNSVLVSVSSYVKHQELHLSVKNRTFPCVYDYCFSKFTSLVSFKSHLSREHKQPQSLNIDLPANTVCPVKNCSDVYEATLLSHLMKHLDEGHQFVCPMPGCQTNHYRKEYFRTHLSRYHRIIEVPEVSDDHGEKEIMDSSNEDMEFEDIGHNSSSPEPTLNNPVLDWTDDPDDDPFPEHCIKEEVLRFYLKLEGSLILPSSAVQIISEEISLITEMSHHALKRALRNEMINAGISESVVTLLISKSFKCDPVYNIHHKNEDVEQVSSSYLRRQLMKRWFSFVDPIEIQLGEDAAGKSRVAHYVPVRESLSALLKDSKVQKEVQKSFSLADRSDDILEDFTDGSAYKEHKKQHERGKCLQLFLFQDGFEFSPFGPAKGLYKSLGVYFMLGNLPPEYRSRVDLIDLVSLIQERDLKTSDEEYLQGIDKFEVILDRLIADLNDLKLNGIQVGEEVIPVCLLFCLGDNAGSHQIGSFVQNFSSSIFFCRYCPISRAEFLNEPHKCKKLRSPQEYDECVQRAKLRWNTEMSSLLKVRKQSKKRAEKASSRCRAPENKTILKRTITKSGLIKLRAISSCGVKPRPSALNKVAGFHVSSPALPPCLAHDLFEGIINTVLPKIIKHLVNKNWFTLDTLNRRIRAFKYKGSDAADAPNAIKSFDGIKGHACENWTFLRLLPFIIGDLIIDKEDEMWQLYLELKEICEYVCAPKITMSQVAYLKVLIEKYLCGIKKLFPSSLIPKQHYLCHYPDLIVIFGPLIRLFTLRFESFHVFFKRAARACKNFVNITFTLAQKYQLKFAYDHSNAVLPPNVKYEPNSMSTIFVNNCPNDVKLALSSIVSLEEYKTLDHVSINGISYKRNFWFEVDKVNLDDLAVGCIEMILCNSSDEIKFVLRQYTAVNTYSGYFAVEDMRDTICIKTLEDLPDYYALPSYTVNGQECLSLKHSVVCM